MAGAGAVVAFFLAFSLAVSWVAGDKEREQLADMVEETIKKKQELEDQVYTHKKKLEKETKELSKLQRDLKKELALKRRLKRRLALEKRKQRIAEQRGDSYTVDMEAERDKLRAKLEAENKKQIAELQKKLKEVEKAKKGIEAQMRRKIEEEASRKAAEAISEAELARKRAEDAMSRIKRLRERLMDVKKSKIEIEKSLKDLEENRHEAEAKLEKERRARAELEKKFSEMRESYLAALSSDVEAGSGAAAAAGSGEGAGSAVASAEAVLVKQLEEARKDAERKVEEQGDRIAELSDEIETLKKEKTELAGVAEANLERLTALKKRLVDSREKEAALVAALEEQKKLHQASDTVMADREKLAAEYDKKVATLNDRLAEAAAAKEAYRKEAKSEIERLKSHSASLEERNRRLAMQLQESRVALAEATTEGEAARELIARNAELEAKLKEAGLVELQGKAASYVAKKLIERNAELVVQIKEAKLALAKSEASKNRIKAAMADNSELASMLKDAKVQLAKGDPTDVISSLKTRNTELEQRIQRAEEALAQSEANRFIIDELKSRNNALEARLTKRQMVTGGDTSAVKELRESSRALDTELAEETKATTVLEKKLSEAVDAKLAGEEAIAAIAAARAGAESRLEAKEKAAKDLRARLNEALEQQKAAEEKVRDLQFAKKDVERKLLEEVEARRKLEARLTEGETLVDDANLDSKIKDLKSALAETETELSRERAERKRLETRLENIKSAGARMLSRTAAEEEGREMDLPTLRSRLAGIKQTLAEKLKTGEVEAQEFLRLLDVEEILGFYVVRPGDTLWNIASSDRGYGDPMLWPLLYRYNLGKISQPDMIEPDQVIIIYKDVTAVEKSDARAKAFNRGDWRKWSNADKRAWVEDWTE